MPSTHVAIKIGVWSSEELRPNQPDMKAFDWLVRSNGGKPPAPDDTIAF
jgi:hypothetical protein